MATTQIKITKNPNETYSLNNISGGFTKDYSANDLSGLVGNTPNSNYSVQNDAGGFDNMTGQQISSKYALPGYVDEHAPTDWMKANPNQGLAAPIGIPGIRDSVIGKIVNPSAPQGYDSPPPPQTTPQMESQTRLDGKGQPYTVQVPIGTFNPNPVSNPSDASKYQQGLANTQASGVPAPTTQGGALGTIAGTLPTPPPDTSNIDTALAEDKGYQQLLKDQADYTNVVNQQKTLTDTYNDLITKAGIPAINAELLNTNKIIEGTEDDIRAEVQAVSGFATDSQVLALASARNKSLIKNYNNLLDTKKMAMESVNTMIGLAQSDKETALNNIITKMGIDEKIASYTDKFVQNAKEGYANYIKAVGYSGLYNSLANSGDPTAISTVEKTLGLPSGALAQAAQSEQIAAQQEAQKAEVEARKADLQNQVLESNLKTDALQRSNINSQINERNSASISSGTISGKPQTASQSSANGYADRLNENNILITDLGKKFTGVLAGIPLPNILKSGDKQAYETAKTNFVTAVLRRESGAAISPSEFSTAERQYFPQSGDKPNVVAQKERARNTAINNLYREADINRPVLPGQTITSNGRSYRVAPDGQTLIPQ